MEMKKGLQENMKLKILINFLGVYLTEQQVYAYQFHVYKMDIKEDWKIEDQLQMQIHIQLLQ